MMTRILAVNLAAWLVAAAAAAAAEPKNRGADENPEAGMTPPQFEQVDKLLSQTGRLLVELQADVIRAPSASGTVKPKGKGQVAGSYSKRFSAECAKGFKMTDRAVAERIGKGLPVLRSFVRYFHCQAHQSNDPSVCDGLSRLAFKGMSGADHVRACKEDFEPMRLAKHVISGDPKARQVCEGTQVFTGLLASRASRGKACGILLGGGNPQAKCRQLIPLWGKDAPAQAKKHCAEAIGAYVGDPGHCTDKSFVKTLCRATVAYRAAVKAGSLKACGKNHECRWMKGGPGICSAYARAVKDAYCKDFAGAKVEKEIDGLQLYEAALREEQEKKLRGESAAEMLRRRRVPLDQMLAQAREMLDGVEPRSHPGLKARQSKLEGQTKQLEAIASKAHAKSPKPPKR